MTESKRHKKLFKIESNLEKLQDFLLVILFTVLHASADHFLVTEVLIEKFYFQYTNLRVKATILKLRLREDWDLIEGGRNINKPFSLGEGSSEESNINTTSTMKHNIYT